MVALAKEHMSPQPMDRTAMRSWTDELAAVEARLGPHFGRVEVRDRARVAFWGRAQEWLATRLRHGPHRAVWVATSTGLGPVGRRRGPRRAARLRV